MGENYYEIANVDEETKVILDVEVNKMKFIDGLLFKFIFDQNVVENNPKNKNTIGVVEQQGEEVIGLEELILPIEEQSIYYFEENHFSDEISYRKCNNDK
ncbi:8634_t:CDS:2, partial [Diversispora eburnea]